jgi:hypothetical protein
MLAAFSLFALTDEAQAWGSIGHRIVGQVADKHLTPKAAWEVSKIIGTNSLGDVATWMDDIRGTPQGDAMADWHFQRVEACSGAAGTCVHNKCAGPKIDEQIAALRAKKGNQKNALRVLVHLIGDVHQPLHAAENHDVGGNGVIIANRWCVNNKGKSVPCKLHTYWDNSLVKLAKGNDSDANFVATLADMNVDGGGTSASWIKESNDLAKQKVHQYEGFACNIAKKDVLLDEAYDQAGTALVKARLAAAGKRLAMVLNDVYK